MVIYKKKNVMAMTLGIRGGSSSVRFLSFCAAVVCTVVLIFVYFRLESKITGLDDARQSLELYIAKLQPLDLEKLRNPPTDTHHQEFGTSLSGLDISDDFVIIYNRVPKTGSTTLMGFAYDLCEVNKYHVLHVNISRNSHILSLADQARFAYNVTAWTEMKPALYHGHFAYVDFSRFGINAHPIYINVLRKPLDRLVSYYYFLRYGDDYRPHVVRKKTGDKMTFDECVEKEEINCAPENMWLQIPFFCGHSSECWDPGNEWALMQAKQNLINNYMLVGVTEELQDFVAMLEATLPRFFKGATQLYISGKKSHLRRTATKIEPLPKTIAKIQTSPIWKMENEFYEFALEQFHFMKKKSIAIKIGSQVDRGQKFMYEKIRPKLDRGVT